MINSLISLAVTVSLSALYFSLFVIFIRREEKYEAERTKALLDYTTAKEELRRSVDSNTQVLASLREVILDSRFGPKIRRE